MLSKIQLLNCMKLKADMEFRTFAIGRDDRFRFKHELNFKQKFSIQSLLIIDLLRVVDMLESASAIS